MLSCYILFSLPSAHESMAACSAWSYSTLTHVPYLIIEEFNLCSLKHKLSSPGGDDDTDVVFFCYSWCCACMNLLPWSHEDRQKSAFSNPTALQG